MSDAEMSRREMTIYLYTVGILLVVGFLFGWLDWLHFNATLTQQIKQLMKDLDTKSGATWPHEMLRLFLHNAASATELALFGFAFGLFPMYTIWFNGLMIGFVTHLTEQQGVSPWETILYGLLPHGIFELSAILWAAALGMANGMAVIRSIRIRFNPDSNRPSSNRRPSDTGEGRRWARTTHPVRYAFLRTARRLPIIWGILLVAAFVESAVTPHIMAWGIPMLHQ